MWLVSSKCPGGVAGVWALKAFETGGRTIGIRPSTLDVGVHPQHAAPISIPLGTGFGFAWAFPPAERVACSLSSPSLGFDGFCGRGSGKTNYMVSKTMRP